MKSNYPIFIRCSRILATALVAIGLTGCDNFHPLQILPVASAHTSNLVCYAAFISGENPLRVFQEEVLPRRGMGLIGPLLTYRIDDHKKEVTTSIAGLFESRAAYRDGYGCRTVVGAPPADPVPNKLFAPPAAAGTLGDIAGEGMVTAVDPRVRQAIDEAFVENRKLPRQTKAVVVVHHGRVIGEKYADDIRMDTAMWAHSITKSLNHALVGVLVQQGKLDAMRPVRIPEWSGADDPRRNITIDQLLRMTSGLAQDEFATPMDPAYRMFFLERDWYAFAASAQLEAAPGTQWRYSNYSHAIVSRLIRDAVGGRAIDVFNFARDELFGPLGMQSAVMSYDATGTPMGAGFSYASARDWARFGLLYLHDGVVNGKRIFPAGWVQQARTPSPKTGAGYGSGFFLNVTNAPRSNGLPPWGMPGAPKDAYYAYGSMGQFIVIVPSLDLVVVRLGLAHGVGFDTEGVGRLVAQLAEAVKP